MSPSIGVLAAAAALLVSGLVPVPPAGPSGELRPSGHDLVVGSTATAGSEAKPSDVWLIVDLDVDPLASYDGRLPGLPATSPAVTGARGLDRASPRARRYLAYVDGQQRAFQRRLRARVPGAAVVQRFDMVVGGATVRVPAGFEGAVARLPGVRAVHPVELLPLLTDSTPALVGADELWEELGGQARAGEGVVVGVVDTGVWPEHPSFADPVDGPAAYPPPPASWDADAPCEFGEPEDSALEEPFACNNKLLAARNVQDTYRQIEGIGPGEYDSALDADGHGTHVASTAVGNAGVDAGPLGTISGIAPRAHLAVYKACGARGCYSTDAVAAIDQAVADGVDVINYSIGGGLDPYADPVSLAFLDAYEAGVVVVAAAGNAGPAPGSVHHRQPWTITVGATTSARTFSSRLRLEAEGGAVLDVAGASLTAGLADPAPLVRAQDHGSDARCLQPFDPGVLDGAVVLCETTGGGAYLKGQNAAVGGAAAMVLYETAGTGVTLENHVLPVVRLASAEAATLLAFLAEHPGAEVLIGDPESVPAEADVVAPFSGRSGPSLTTGVAKPDLVAPGTGILAGHTPYPANGRDGHRFRVAHGTSMAAPHVAGAVALLRQARPEWSPAEIRSALMLTAAGGVRAGEGLAGPFDAGSGRLDVMGAAGAALTMPEPAGRFHELRHRLWDLNYPSVSLPVGAEAVTVERRFADATGEGATWAVAVDPPEGVVVEAPGELAVPPDGTGTLRLRMDVTGLEVGETRHGRVVLSHGAHAPLRLPLTVRREEPELSLSGGCLPDPLAFGATTTCELAIGNTGHLDRAVDLRLDVPGHLAVVEGSVAGATIEGGTLSFSGAVAGAPPAVEAEQRQHGSPHGYVPLQGVAPLPLGDDSIVNVRLPEEETESVTFGGTDYRTVGIGSNGIVVLGGGDEGDAAASWRNQDLPRPEPPNNVLAPFWTDLDPSRGGAVYADVMTSGEDRWLVVDWQAVPNWSNVAEVNTFQVWIELTAPDRAWFTYGDVTGGSVNNGVRRLTVGAENTVGTSGTAVHFDGQGTPPSPTAPPAGYTVRVTAQAGEPAGSHVVRFEAKGVALGDWDARARLTGEGLAGEQAVTLSGAVEAAVPGRPGSLTATAGKRHIDVAWSAAASRGSPVTGYRVTASPGGHELVLDGSARTARLETLQPGTTYTVAVRATNGIGEGPARSVSATTSPATGPTPTPTPTATATPTPTPTPGPTPPGPTPPGPLPVEPEVRRVSGAERFATAAEVSAATFEPGVPVAFVATGLNFPDALAGSAAAGVLGGPVLLTRSLVLPEPTRDELRRLRPERVVVLGGESVIGQPVVEALRGLAPVVERLSGPDRFATAAAVSAATFPPGVPVAYVATGGNFPDALAGSAAAAARGGPVLLVNQGSLPEATRIELGRVRPERIVVLGGTGAVSPGVVAELGGYAPVSRLSGPDRFSTAVATALDAFSHAPVVHIATGSDYPDALAGSAAAAVASGPVLLVGRDRIPDVTEAALQALGPKKVVVLGGTNAVSEAVAEATLALLRD